MGFILEGNAARFAFASSSSISSLY